MYYCVCFFVVCVLCFFRFCVLRTLTRLRQTAHRNHVTTTTTSPRKDFLGNKIQAAGLGPEMRADETRVVRIATSLGTHKLVGFSPLLTFAIFAIIAICNSKNKN